MKIEEARALYPEAKEALAGISGPWARHYNVDTKRAEICQLDKITGEIEPIIDIHPTCSYQDERFIERAPVLLEALMLLLDEAFRRIRSSQSAAPAQSSRGPKDYAAECAMLCGRGDFRRYLVECHGLDVADDERVKTRVRSILKIRSRGELNTDPDAAARWKDFRQRFNAWKGL